MDAARAARMSDPLRNRQFSRRWRDDPPPVRQPPQQQPDDALGAVGRALLDAWRRREARREQDDGAT